VLEIKSKAKMSLLATLAKNSVRRSARVRTFTRSSVRRAADHDHGDHHEHLVFEVDQYNPKLIRNGVIAIFGLGFGIPFFAVEVQQRKGGFK
jgi:hypothetical protein